jgi:hypothetical protein
LYGLIENAFGDNLEVNAVIQKLTIVSELADVICAVELEAATINTYNKCFDSNEILIERVY